MKLITFTVPCYNSAVYMNKCLDSLLACGSEDEIEIIIVNDGSKDETGAIADEYAARMPKTVRVIHQSNGGHGEGVNQGIGHAEGLYFKVVDSDDWLDVEGGRKLIERMREQSELDSPVDLFICNYVYEYAYDNTQRVMRFNNVFPEGEVISWQETRPFGLTKYMGMHTLYYRTAVLRESGVKLPRHTFYVDNLIAYVPMPYVKTLCYLNLDLYRYFIGRSDQSVSEKVLIKKIDQQLLVNRLLIQSHKREFIETLDIKLQRYMRNYVRIIMAIGISVEMLAGNGKALYKNDENWAILKEMHPDWFQCIRYRSFVALMNLPGKLGHKINQYGYKVVHKVFKFN